MKQHYQVYNKQIITFNIKLVPNSHISKQIQDYHIKDYNTRIVSPSKKPIYINTVSAETEQLTSTPTWHSQYNFALYVKLNQENRVVLNK